MTFYIKNYELYTQMNDLLYLRKVLSPKSRLKIEHLVYEFKLEFSDTKICLS